MRAPRDTRVTLAAAFFLVPTCVLACTVTRPASLPAPVGGGKPPTVPALRVTDSTGHSQWIYQAWVAADTLRGQRYPDTPREGVAIPVAAIKSVAAHQFSGARTAGLVGAVLATFVVFAVIAGPEAVYGGQ